jgi:ArsR family transcriptional regulator
MGAVKLAGNKQIELTEGQMHLIAKALADPRRYELLRQIGRCTAPMQCSQIKDCQPVSAATLSHHMKELETAGLVRAVRDGKFVSYLLVREVLQAYTRQLSEI